MGAEQFFEDGVARANLAVANLILKGSKRPAVSVGDGVVKGIAATEAAILGAGVGVRGHAVSLYVFIPRNKSQRHCNNIGTLLICLG